MRWSQVADMVCAALRPGHNVINRESTWRRPGQRQVNSQVTQPAHSAVTANDVIS